MARLYRVTLTPPERQELQQLISRGKADARKLAHARILLQADEAEGGPRRTDGQIASALDTTTRTVERARERFVEQGREAALPVRPLRPAAPRPARAPVPRGECAEDPFRLNQSGGLGWLWLDGQ